MKIRLDRKLPSCPKLLLCTVTNAAFEVGNIRIFLYTDRGLLLGDISPDCLRLSSSEIRQKLREQACAILHPEEAGCDRDASPTRERALELLQAAQEKVKFPSAFDWWIKKFEIFSEESQEIEAARTGLSDYYVLERSRLQKILDDDRE
ncbi:MULTISPECIES: hypothetical protein [Leptolyngbya]|jgi:hypothetical protein|uniref:Uncharacterized protein n=2 Tax=Leptolyngbya boryana TaxID=1184 RepID=A0A1Z4JPW5_LEPBY|nr:MULTISPECIES: hypothetical protein [Leptolyngbya]BAY58693.1 hypothetical protein NIES2135_55660 [Leptolyngbya boryana NIES-2135]MBD2370158.1 hypothetical protein [Leptolyngbya sp. FACHB-161]MBD2376503.1 hypothetical protein [Leptolyngbya sp. FACHB-238]MBD2400776.1 hypothetical protein [Leptolyngbya sp. FACHB-239]MBD2407320.1 hypothetical protein [Leptolyngbya sp. FACHB-402]